MVTVGAGFLEKGRREGAAPRPHPGAPEMVQDAVLPVALVRSTAAFQGRCAGRAPADPIESEKSSRSSHDRFLASMSLVRNIAGGMLTRVRLMRHCSIAAALAWLMAYGGAQAAPPDPTGLWSTKDDKSIIEISPCGPFYCGILVWLEEPNDIAGKPKTDHENEDESLRDRPLLGVQLLTDLAPEKNHWHGKAYNPEDGKTYDITFKPAAGKAIGDKAEIRGCVLKFLCQSETFTRVLALPNGVAAPTAPPAPGPDKAKPKPPSSKP
jgi:uncharacterized protein (DUF2147 family)